MSVRTAGALHIASKRRQASGGEYQTALQASSTVADVSNIFPKKSAGSRRGTTVLHGVAILPLSMGQRPTIG